jgi:DNA repair protein RadC
VSRRSGFRPASTIAEAAPDARPRERLLAGGAQVLSDAQLLAVVLRNGRPGASALEVASELLIKAGGLPGLAGNGGVRRPVQGPG